MINGEMEKGKHAVKRYEIQDLENHHESFILSSTEDSARKTAEYLAEDHRVKSAHSSAFPRTVTVLLAAGECLTVCLLPSCDSIFSSFFFCTLAAGSVYVTRVFL